MRFFIVVGLVPSGSDMRVAALSSDWNFPLRAWESRRFIRGPQLMRRASSRGISSHSMVGRCCATGSLAFWLEYRGGGMLGRDYMYARKIAQDDEHS
jgi:hypothetical protein